MTAAYKTTAGSAGANSLSTLVGSGVRATNIRKAKLIQISPASNRAITRNLR